MYPRIVDYVNGLILPFCNTCELYSQYNLPSKGQGNTCKSVGKAETRIVGVVTTTFMSYISITYCPGTAQYESNKRRFCQIFSTPAQMINNKYEPGCCPVHTKLAIYNGLSEPKII